MPCCVVLHALLYLLFHIRCQYHQVLAELSLARQLSSAQQRTAALAQQRNAVQCRALPYGAVLCDDMPCFAVLRALLYLLFRTCQIRSIILGTGTTTHTRFVRTTLKHKICILSSAQPSYSSAAQRRVVPCGAVFCVLGAVLCRAALCFLSNI